jgi:hypothetical protein
VDEHGLEVQELRRDLEIQLGHQHQVLVVLAADLGDLDVAQVHIVLANEMKQEIEARRTAAGAPDRAGGTPARQVRDRMPSTALGLPAGT